MKPEDEPIRENNYQKAFGKRLIVERQKRNWSQNDLAEKIGDGTVVNTVSRWENGKNFPSPYCRQRLCEVLDMSPNELFRAFLEAIVKGTEIGPIGTPEDQNKEGSQLVCSAGAIRFQSVFYFNAPFPLRRAEFYGRKRELEAVFDCLEKRQSISFVGSRRIGKTWLLRYLQLAVPTRLGEHYRVGYIDSSEHRCQTMNGIVDTILHELGIAPPEDLSRNDPLTRLEKALKQPLEKVFVLCIDEFEGLCASKEFDEDLIIELRSLATNHGLRIVTASRDSLFNLINKNRSGKTSPLFNIFRQAQLGPFNREDARYFATEKGKQAGFTTQNQEYLLKFAQLNEDQQEWYPLLLQLVGQVLQEEKHFETYRPNDPDYWQKFKDALSWQLSGIMS